MKKIKSEAAIERINEKGILLVFPIKNQSEPASLWSEFYPRSTMSWNWDEDGDDRVMYLWATMKKLSNCGDVVYSKWYKGRATFFSKELFVHLLAYTRTWRESSAWNTASRDILDLLENDSPLSTKFIKKYTGLVGKDFSAEYDRSMRFLFQRFLILSFGEVEDGAFPSSALGATSLLFEELWLQSQLISPSDAKAAVDRYMPPDSTTRKFLESTMAKNKTK